MVDLNKEIKLSDLFRRGSKPPAEGDAAPAEAVAQAPQPEAEKKSLMKREISFGRRKRAEGEPKAEKPKRERRAKREKAPKEPRAKRTRGAKAVAAQPLPAVPLMRAFDLMPRDDVRAEGAARRPSTAQLVLAVVGLVLLAGLASYFLITNAQVADKQTKVDDLRSKLAALEVPQEKPVPQGSDQGLVTERDNRTGALATVLARRIAWDRVLRDLSLVMPEDVWLDGLTASAAAPTDAVTQGGPPPDPTATPSASTFQVTGYARKQASVAQLLSRMQVLPEVSAAQLVSAATVTVGGEDVIQFTVAGTLKPTATGGAA